MSKPLMERKRRARINEALSQLKALVLATTSAKEEKLPQAKMEKADILEMTVRYLESIQSNRRDTVSTSDNHYKVGYNTCLREIMKFVGSDVIKNFKIKSELLQSLSKYFLAVTLNSEREDVKQETETECEPLSRDHSDDKRIPEINGCRNAATDGHRHNYEKETLPVDRQGKCWVISMTEHGDNSSQSYAPFISFPLAFPDTTHTPPLSIMSSVHICKKPTDTTDALTYNDSHLSSSDGNGTVHNRHSAICEEHISATKSEYSDYCKKRDTSKGDVVFCTSHWRPW
ncbi:hypothetical protein ScPMuIL_007737 [Solemya velum]